jgi:hypothetical protein
MWFIDQIDQYHMIHIKEKFIAQQVMFEFVQAKTIVKVFFLFCYNFVLLCSKA